MVSTAAPGKDNVKDAEPRSALASAAVVFSGFFAVYYATRQSNLSTYHDAIGHLKAVLTEHGPHPHHLFFRWMERGWLWVAGTLEGSPSAAANSAATLSALVAAATVTLVFLILRLRFGLSTFAAVLGASLVGFSYGPWLHATVINVYIMPLALLLACLFLLSGEGARPRTYAAVGALHALAVLIHQAYGLFALVVVAAACMTGADRAALRRLLVYGAVFGALVGIPYVLVGTLVQRATGPGDFLYWLTSYAHDNYWSAPGVNGALKAVVGYVRAIFGLLFVLAIPATRMSVAGALGRSVADEEYVVRNLPPAAATALLIVTCVGGLLALAMLVARAPDVSRLWARHRRPLVLTVTTLFVFTGFFLFWMPQLLEFWIPQVTAFWMLWAAIVLQRGRDGRWPLWAGVVICASLVLSNFYGGIRYLASPHDDYYYACAEATGAHVARDDTVMVESEYLSDYLSLFYGIRPVRLTVAKPQSSAAVASVISDASPALDGAGPAAPAHVLVADARTGVYVAGGAVPPPMLTSARWKAHALVQVPCELWQLTPTR